MKTTEETVRSDFESTGGFDALIEDILDLSKCVNPEDHSEFGIDEPYISCRLRYYNGSFQWLTGASDYDRDHRGHWGSSSVTQNMTAEEARSVAEDLFEQVLDSVCMAQDEL